MKLTKRIASLLLALLMVFAMATTAFANETTETGGNTETGDGKTENPGVTVDGTQETGSITINGVSTGNVYEIYRMLDLESYNLTSGAYAYKVNAAWTELFKTDNAKKYVSVDGDGYVTWIGGDDDDAIAAFARSALAYAKANGIAPVKSSKNTGEFVVSTNDETNITSGVFSNLPLGWYLIDSTMGALCGLTTTNPDASVNAKNVPPTIDKQVKEDSTEQWGDANTADIGQTVEFRTTINVHAGAENFVLHDEMEETLTFNGVTKIEHVIPGKGTHTVPSEKYTVVKAGDKDAEGNTLINDECTFEVRFTPAFCGEMNNNDKIIVYYEAMLNRDAVIAGNGNINKSYLEFGENHYTTPDTTVTKTFGIDIIKTDSQNTLLDGAEFRIYDALTNGNEVGVVLMEDGVTYRRARADEQTDGKTVNIVVKNGKVRVVGLDNGTYYLEEKVAPKGCNKLSARQKFIISDGNLDAIFNGAVYSTGSGVHVVNKSGTMLPETGGVGTTLFYVIGGVLVLGAVVLLVTKKRMQTK